MADGNRHEIKSSNIRSITYFPAEMTLEVEFTSGPSYRYDGVPPAEVDAMLEADSKGQYFAANIKRRYKCTKCEPVKKETE